MQAFDDQDAKSMFQDLGFLMHGHDLGRASA